MYNTKEDRHEPTNKTSPQRKQISEQLIINETQQFKSLLSYEKMSLRAKEKRKKNRRDTKRRKKGTKNIDCK